MEQDLTKEILALLDNNHTTVAEVSDINSNYYSYITDTIYLATNMDSKKKRLDNTNLFCGRIVTICHECVHSVQNIGLHILNLILSNLSLIFAVISIILTLISIKPTWYIISGCIIIFLAILIRLLLEIDAIHKSLSLAEKVVASLKIENVNYNDIDEAKKTVKRLLPIQIVRMILDKIIMLVIIVI